MIAVDSNLLVYAHREDSPITPFDKIHTKLCYSFQYL